MLSLVGMMRLTPEGMFKLFKPTLENIVQVLDDILQSPALSGSGVDYMFLVGGFAESPVLQKYLRDTYKDKIQLIIPQGRFRKILFLQITPLYSFNQSSIK